MENKVTLYIAEHNITKKKYFGKTIRYFTKESLQKHYKGSGLYWKRHLNKHGKDIIMSIYGIFSLDENSPDYVEPIALAFSEENDIVDSKEWANFKPENGLDGAVKGHALNKGRKHSKETRVKQSKAHKGCKRYFISNNIIQKHFLDKLVKNDFLKQNKDWYDGQVGIGACKLGKVCAKDMRTDKRIFVTKEEYKNNKYLISSKTKKVQIEKNNQIIFTGYLALFLINNKQYPKRQMMDALRSNDGNVYVKCGKKKWLNDEHLNLQWLL